MTLSYSLHEHNLAWITATCTMSSKLSGCGHFWPIERSRLPTVIICLLCNQYYLGFRKDPYWARCCAFCTQLSWPWSLTVMASACTSMPMTCRFTSAHRLVTLRLPSDVFLHISSTLRHGWRPADFDWTPPRPRWCGWDLHSSWQKSMFRSFQWRRHISTSRRRRITSTSTSTASWCCLHRCPPCVAVAITSFGSSDRLSDRCHLTLSRRWSRRSFHVAWTTFLTGPLFSLAFLLHHRWSDEQAAVCTECSCTVGVTD